MTKNELKPKIVFDEFAKINRIPRPSKHEEKIIEYLKGVGEELGLPTKVDEVGNVVISKSATPGYEDKPTVILQSHMDMVCESLAGKEIDFENDPIETFVDGEWLKADRTTLGADDGIGVAMELALLRSENIEHGPVECVFTRDEETGLTGAMGMKEGFMTGDYLINLDSEDEGQFFISCAGGIGTTAVFKYEREAVGNDYFFVEAEIKGLLGGHSGDDINKKRANSIKLMARFLYQEMQKMPVRLAVFDGGKAHNAIPRDCKAVFAVPVSKKEDVKADWNIYASEVAAEYHVTEPGIEMLMGSAEPREVITDDVTGRIVRALQAVDNGVFSMCQEEELSWLVETSSNLASVRTQCSEMEVVTSQRSCVMSQRDNIAAAVKACFELAGAEVEQGDGYPAWQPRANSHLVDVTAETYRKLFDKEPKILGIHAGLECGLFAERYPNLDMVSMGPTLRGVHSPDEKLHIPSVQMVWNHLLEILKNI
ncbi:MAG: aminoacyl-histidine dipeptidase [Bacteroidales bacterium]|nr:aminoacyl-histidine dipeptidase [Bacteroidales bacterium]MCM1147946.1 aminoacyl-histidine dipeptidase [Bacteroidales bacterium]MCM1206870.1 aminoacyl-histidine dipeptidase [Bacillota bacterium]MCM1509503.1 aminoacyl-histidine dipeptidase [Clostridium sp.]